MFKCGLLVSTWSWTKTTSANIPRVYFLAATTRMSQNLECQKWQESLVTSGRSSGRSTAAESHWPLTCPPWEVNSFWLSFLPGSASFGTRLPKLMQLKQICSWIIWKDHFPWITVKFTDPRCLFRPVWLQTTTSQGLLVSRFWQM